MNNSIISIEDVQPDDKQSNASSDESIIIQIKEKKKVKIDDAPDECKVEEDVLEEPVKNEKPKLTCQFCKKAMLSSSLSRHASKCKARPEPEPIPESPEEQVDNTQPDEIIEPIKEEQEEENTVELEEESKPKPKPRKRKPKPKTPLIENIKIEEGAPPPPPPPLTKQFAPLVRLQSRQSMTLDERTDYRRERLNSLMLSAIPGQRRKISNV
jgi:hypothetical protein